MAFAVASASHAALLYHFDYETSLTGNLGSGASTLVSVGTPTLTNGGADGTAQFADFGGGNFATADHQTLDVSTDTISLGNFQFSFYFNNQGVGGDFDDFLSIQHTGLAATDSIGLLYVRNTNIVSFRGVGGNSAATVNDSDWHLAEITGATSGADALLSFSLDGVPVTTGNTVAGGAAQTLTNIWISGRPDGANNRYINAGIDEVMIWNVVPEPASIALLGLGGLAMLVRRRR